MDTRSQPNRTMDRTENLIR